MVTLRLFAQAREAAGTNRVELPVEGDSATVSGVLDVATRQFGEQFSAILSTCNVWLNGEQVPFDTRVHSGDEVAVLPPVSGG